MRVSLLNVEVSFLQVWVEAMALSQRSSEKGRSLPPLLLLPAYQKGWVLGEEGRERGEGGTGGLVGVPGEGRGGGGRRGVK